MDTQGCGPSYTGLHAGRRGRGTSSRRGTGRLWPSRARCAAAVPSDHGASRRCRCRPRTCRGAAASIPYTRHAHTPCTHHAYTVHTPCTHCAHTVRTACMCTCRRAAAAAGLPASAGRPCAARCTRSPRRPAHTRGAAAARRAARVRRHAAPPRAAHPAPPRQACRRSQLAGRPSWRASHRRAVAARGAPG